MSVGAVAAAELPVLNPGPPDDAEQEAVDDAEHDSTDDESSDDESSDDESSDDESSDDESSDDESSADRSRERELGSSGDESGLDVGSNHGTIVSEFTRNTMLTGCEKGQATAAIARGDVEPAGLDEHALAAKLAPFVAKCDDDADHADDADPADVDWKRVRDDQQAAWHDATAAFVADCADHDADHDDDDHDADVGGEPERDEAQSSAGCRAMRDELKQFHEAGKSEWKAARDQEHAERAEAKAEKRAQRDHAATDRGPSRSSSKGASKDD
jgi:hypothetical protein